MNDKQSLLSVEHEVDLQWELDAVGNVFDLLFIFGSSISKVDSISLFLKQFFCFDWIDWIIGE